LAKKKLIVLGASRYQVDAIQTAQRLGCFVISVDNIPENPGHSIADRSYIVDTTDHVGVLEVARKEDIDGIVVVATDVALPTATYVASRLGLFAPPENVIRNTRSKSALRALQRKNGLAFPRYMPLDSLSQLDKEFFCDSRWVLKPEDSSGSKGIFIVESYSDVEKRWPTTLEFSQAKGAILEEYIDGFQGTCEAVLENGDLSLCFFLDRQTVDPPFTATSGHRMPTVLPLASQRLVVAEMKKLCAFLGYTDGPIDCDFVLKGRDVYLLELAPRVGGNSIGRLLKRACDFDITEYAVRYALGERGSLPAQVYTEPVAVIILGVAQSGLLSYRKQAVLDLSECDWVEFFVLDYDPGEQVAAFSNGRNRVGECLIVGDNRSDLGRKIEYLDRALCLSVARQEISSSREDFQIDQMLRSG
jgi:biotin carboxylase